MHKIVINKCFGGYGLSPLAISEVCKRKNLPCYIYVEPDFNSSEYMKVSPTSKKLNGHWWYALNKDYGKVVNSEDISDEDYVFEDFPRHDKDLVAVVEELGEKANGDCADLEVIEINSNLYRIDEYDGAESVETPEDIDWIKLED